MVFPTSPSPPTTSSPTKPLPPPNSTNDAAITISSSATASSSSTTPGPPKPTTYQLFRLESPRNHHNLFLQTNPIAPRGIVFHIQSPTMLFTETPINHLDSLANVFDTMLLGTVAAEDVDHLRQVCRENMPPDQRGEGEERPEDRLKRCRAWVRETVNILTDEGIMDPFVPTATGNFLPRHHHTQHCQHQRHHIHHPYRRRRHQIMLNGGQPVNPALTVQKRD
ncbi:Fc.00g037120.m01.CDS01 [Cosmosporella sp. VM-42]